MKFPVAIALAGVSTMTAVSIGHAAEPLKRTPLATHILEPAKTVSTAHVVRLDFAPGQQTGLHKHPVPVIGYVLEGSFVVQEGGKPAQTFTQGQSILEPANTQIDRFDNASKTAPAVLIATYLTGVDDKELITFLPQR